MLADIISDVEDDQSENRAGLEYPHLYAEKAEAAASKDAMIFNCTQRAAQNTLEYLPVVITCTVITAVKYPILAACVAPGPSAVSSTLMLTAPAILQSETCTASPRCKTCCGWVSSVLRTSPSHASHSTICLHNSVELCLIDCTVSQNNGNTIHINPPDSLGGCWKCLQMFVNSTGLHSALAEHLCTVLLIRVTKVACNVQVDSQRRRTAVGSGNGRVEGTRLHCEQELYAYWSVENAGLGLQR